MSKDTMSPEKLSPEAEAFLKKVLKKIGHAAPVGIGALDSSWLKTDLAHGDFIDALRGWDKDGQPEEGKDLVREAAKGFVNAWREVAAEYGKEKS